MAVLDSDSLLRRVLFTNPSYVRPDLTVTSFAFTPRRIDGVVEALSVDISRLTTYERSIHDRTKFRLYAVNAGYVRNIGLECKHDPIEGNDAHALIVGEIKNATAKKLARSAVRIPYP
jgi:hypothetical protein